ncbi:hypothetical protein Tco_0512039 [Tanacetum coccineum]
MSRRTLLIGVRYMLYPEPRIPTTVPATTHTIDPPVIHDDTSLIPTETPTISPITSRIPPTTPTKHYTYLFIHTDSSDDDTPDTLPSPTHEIPPVKVAPLTVQILPVPFGVRLDYSSSDHFTSDDSSRDSPLDSSSKTPSYSSSVGPSRKRSRSPTTSISVSSPIPGALSSVRADLLPPRKRIWSSDSVTDLEAEIDECIAYADALRARGIDTRVVVETVAREEVKTSVRGTVMVSDDRVAHPVVLDDIFELAQEEGAIKVTYEALEDLVQRFHDHTMKILVHRVQVIESIQRDQGHRIVATGQQGAVMLERISKLKWDNTRLRGMLDVASQRVARF